MKAKIIGLLALFGFAFLATCELIGNQASLYMKPEVNGLYGVNATNLLATVSSWAVSGVLLILTFFLRRFAKRIQLLGIVGFAAMALCYLVLGLLSPSANIAIGLLLVAGAASFAIPFVRDAVKNVPMGNLKLSPNQIVSGMVLILSQLAPVAVAAGGVALGPRLTWSIIAIGLVGATVLGAYLFTKYGTPLRAAETTRQAWTPWSRRAALTNGLSAMAVGSILGPLTSEFAQRNLSVVAWMGYWGIGSLFIGFFLMAGWAIIAPRFADHGLMFASITTACGGAIAVVLHSSTGGLVILISGLIVSLGANAFEGSIYAVRPEAESSLTVAIAVNFGRALGFSLGSYVALVFLENSEYTWITLAVSLAGALATYLLRKHWRTTNI